MMHAAEVTEGINHNLRYPGTFMPSDELSAIRIDEKELVAQNAVPAAQGEATPLRQANSPPSIKNVEALIAQGRSADAVAAAREIARSQPYDPNAWNALGVALRADQKAESATIAYARAIELGGERPAFLTNYGNALKTLQRCEEAIPLQVRATQLDPSSALAHMNLAMTLRAAGHVEAALASIERALELKPEDANLHFNRAELLLIQGIYPEGWNEYEWRWKLAEVSAPHHSCPQWDGREARDKTVLLWPEQGFGDAILAARFVPLVRRRVGRVILVCRPELKRLFETLESVDQVISTDQKPPPFDMHFPMMSLPGLFIKTDEDIPPPAHFRVGTHPSLRQLFEPYQNRFKIGIIWSGSVTFRTNHLRSTTIERFLPFGACPHVQLFSLQMGPRAPELQMSGAESVIVDITTHLRDFADTAVALGMLDLVIMTDSSVAHLAGSLNRPIWNLLPCVPYWLYRRHSSETVWYPSMRLFRQPCPGDWDTVFMQAATALRSTLRSRGPATTSYAEYAA